jgi:hypothetical protein
MYCRVMRTQQEVTLSIDNAPIEGSVREEGGGCGRFEGQECGMRRKLQFQMIFHLII